MHETLNRMRYLLRYDAITILTSANVGVIQSQKYEMQGSGFKTKTKQ